MNFSKDLIFPWNEADSQGARSDSPPPKYSHKFELDDETLRDGMQSASVISPSISEKIQILHFMEELGVDIADIGLPGAGPRIQQDVEMLATEISRQNMRIRAACAARTMIEDIAPIARITQKTGVPIEVHAFIGSSPIRHFTENWSPEKLLHQIETTFEFCNREKLEVMFVTEDTTRASPKMLEELYGTAIRCGARRICISEYGGIRVPSRNRQSHCLPPEDDRKNRGRCKG